MATLNQLEITEFNCDVTSGSTRSLAAEIDSFGNGRPTVNQSEKVNYE